MAVVEKLTDEEAFDLIANEWPVYATKLVKIVTKAGPIIPLDPRPGQLKLWAALKAQRDAGQPMRARVAKARQIGFSSMTQTLFLQRATTRANHRAYTVAHNRDAVANLAKMTEIAYAYLPDNPQVKPKIVNTRRSHEYVFGEQAKAARQQGRIGINSSMKYDTASEMDAGRSETINSLHCSELAFWRDAKEKLRGLLQAVSDDPDSLIVQESTANGYNYWRDLWYKDDDYAKVFVAWWEEPTYRLEFTDQEERETFVSSIGTDPDFGDYEADAYTRYSLEPEQLNWWRWALRNKADGDLRTMQQEYPGNPEEMFLATGQKVFDPIRVARLMRDVEEEHRTVPPETGVLRANRFETRKTLSGTLEVPQDPVWVPSSEARLTVHDPSWEIWAHPVAKDEQTGESAGQYVIGCDPASEEESESGESAYHAIEVVDHRTDLQVAEFRAKGLDAFELASMLVLAGLYWNRAWIAVEVTGGWGAPAVRHLHRDFRYPFVYTRKSLERGKEHFEDRLGWDSNKVSKRFLIEDTRADLRDGTTGIRSPGLARELSTLVKDRKGMAAPESGEFADRFMAWAIAKRVAQEKPVRPDRKPGHTTSTATSRSPRTMGRR